MVEQKIIVRDTLCHPISTLLHELAIGVGSHNERAVRKTGLINKLLLHGRLNFNHLRHLLRNWLGLNLGWHHDWLLERGSIYHLLNLRNVRIDNMLDFLHLDRHMIWN